MSSGHSHFGSGGHGTLVLDRLLKNKDVQNHLFKGFRLSRDFDLPYLGGYSKDGGVIYLDRHLPENIKFEFDGKVKEFNPTPHIVDHERFEKAVMDVLGWGYSHAHQAATAYERRGVLKAGIPWQPYQNSLKPFIKVDEHEHLQKVPADLDMAPYYAPPVDKSLIARMEKVMGGKSASKKSKDSVEYSDGHPGSHCGPVKAWPHGDCEHYEDHQCELVSGYIEPRKWCKLWEAVKKS